MKERTATLWLIFVIINVFLVYEVTHACNEAVCASIVSKCLLTQSCKCDLKNCTCCKDCSNCLNYLYSECCSCVNMCPQPNNTNTESNRKSHIEELTDEFPELFKALTVEKDELLRWVTYTFPAHHNLAVLNPNEGKVMRFTTASTTEERSEISKEASEPNCTVAYLSNCMSWNKCKASCLSMGAASYRWFHDACCECVGGNCINYGVNESRCLNCPLSKDELDNFEEIPIEETKEGENNDVLVDDLSPKEIDPDAVKTEDAKPEEENPIS